MRYLEARCLVAGMATRGNYTTKNAVDNRTGDEIAFDVISKAGLSVRG